MRDIINNFNEDRFKGDIKKDDPDYLDAFDHVVVKMANQYKYDLKFGIPFELGPFLDKQGTKWSIIIAGILILIGASIYFLFLK